MLRSALTTMMLRELRAVRRSIEAYPDDAGPWAAVPGLPNSGGNLALHIAGNLRHFVGKGLGGVPYVRDRDAEFARRSGTRAELVAGIDAAIEAVERGMGAATDAVLAAPLAEPVGGRRLNTADFLTHLAVHLGYHLGQLDSHRRMVTGNAAGIGAVAPAELPEAR